MFPQQPATSITTDRYSLIDCVLRLRQQLGINLSLSLSGAEDMLLAPREQQTSSIETSQHVSPTYDRQGWLAWSQSPAEGMLPEEGPEELRRCQ